MPWLLLATAGCVEAPDPELSGGRRMDVLRVGEHRPEASELTAVGRLERKITRKEPAFSTLVECEAAGLVFKDEEQTGADRRGQPELCARLARLAPRVSATWPGIELRVTEAWDEDGEHGARSLHYEGRAADLTTSDRDPNKLGRLGGLAVEAGFGWVYREHTHIHASVRRR